MKHQKHTKMNRPQLGEYGRNEWAILGTTCGEIQKLAQDLNQTLQEKFNIAYVDADHKSDSTNESGGLSFHAQYTDKISHHQFAENGALNPFDFKFKLSDCDLILVNGNHFKATKQIVVLDKRKAESLERKKDRLDNVKLILKYDEVEIPSYLKSIISNSEDEIPVFSFHEIERIAKFLEAGTVVPALNGLVLAGGKSVRMGQDKGKINYHGKDQRDYLWELLDRHCENTFISCRDDQRTELEGKWFLSDKLPGYGAFGAIISAFLSNPNDAILVVACDMPFVNDEVIAELIAGRDSRKFATAFHNEETGFPDPLLTIYEPKSYQRLLQFMSLGYSCPRKMLINSDVKSIVPRSPNYLRNINTKEEFKNFEKG